MYFVLKPNIGLTSQFIYFGKMPKGFDTSVLRDAASLKGLPADITLTAENEKALPFSDLILASDFLLVMSPALRACLASAGISNIEYFPVSLVDQTSGKIVSDYMLANIVGSVACLDLANSVAKTFASDDDDAPPRYRVVEKFDLEVKRIRQSSLENGEPHLFRLGEFKYHVIADDSLKSAIEDAGITGVKLTPTRDFV